MAAVARRQAVSSRVKLRAFLLRFDRPTTEVMAKAAATSMALPMFLIASCSFEKRYVVKLILVATEKRSQLERTGEIFFLIVR